MLCSSLRYVSHFTPNKFLRSFPFPTKYPNFDPCFCFSFSTSTTFYPQNDNNDHHNLVSMFNQLLRNKNSTPHIINGLCLKGHIHQALHFHDKLLALELCKLGQTTAALQLLRRVDGKLVQPNVVMYNTIIDGMCKDKLVIEAFDLYSQMVAKRISLDVVTYNALISGFCFVGKLNDAIRLFNKMTLKNIIPDVYTFNILVDAFCKEGKMKKAKKVLALMMKKDVKPDVVTYNSLMDGYCLVNEMITRGLL